MIHQEDRTDYSLANDVLPTNEAIQVAEEPFSLLKFARHLVLVSLLAGIHPFWVLGASFGFAHTFGTVAALLAFSAVITGLAKLFFTQGMGRNWHANFIKCMWVLSLLSLAGQWYK